MTSEISMGLSFFSQERTFDQRSIAFLLKRLEIDSMHEVSQKIRLAS